MNINCSTTTLTHVQLWPVEAPGAPFSASLCYCWHKPAEQAPGTGTALPLSSEARAQALQMFKIFFIPEKTSSTQISRAGSITYKTV